MSKLKSKYVCQNCGFSSVRWSGKCPECNNWNSMSEELITPEKDKRDRQNSKSILKVNENNFKALSEITSINESRTKTQITELDRVLGGGIVDGSVILIGGDPGIGKSTLMLQLAEKIDDKKILYVSGEESASQIKLRADRLNFNLNNFFILSETNLDIIQAVIERENPEIVVVDSISTFAKTSDLNC